MERENKKQKKETEEKEEDEPWPEFFTEPTGPTYRTPPYDSELRSFYSPHVLR
jgi:hypothetical protein